MEIGTWEESLDHCLLFSRPSAIEFPMQPWRCWFDNNTEQFFFNSTKANCQEPVGKQEPLWEGWFLAVG